MRDGLLIVGQGLAGTLLGLACEQAGVVFTMVDAGHGEASSRVGAGIINPITGQRFAKSWGIDELGPLARRTYRGLEDVLGVPLLREMRVRRFFRDERERAAWAGKAGRGDLAAYAGEADAEGFWIEGAMRVDTGMLIAEARRRWLRAGRLREARVTISEALAGHDRVIACTGASPGEGGQAWGGVACTCATGDVLRLAAEGLDPGVILNRGHWVLPTQAGEALAGATYLRGETGAGACARPVDTDVVASARRELSASAAALLGGREFTVMAQEAGVRVATPDRLPLAGWVPGVARLGVINGLGSKGALLGPWLARQWVRHLAEGAALEAAVAVNRFARP